MQRLHPEEDLAPLFAAVRVRLGLVAALFVLAGVGWWWTAGQMRGMDEGPWTGLGTLGWFLGVWVVMMAAMMFPSVSPTIALYSRMTRSLSPVLPLSFTAGYLGTWTGAGLLAFGIGAVAHRIPGDPLSWDSAGRQVAAATLLVAGLYELSPIKDVCLRRCRSPLGTLLSNWRDGWSGALRMGTVNGAWCVGCCWALMASLFALGVMSIVWMALVAAVIAVEKTVPGRRLITYGTSVLLLVLGVLLLVAPDVLPALTVPGTDSMGGMTPMGS